MKFDFKLIAVVVVAVVGTFFAYKYFSSSKKREKFAIGYYDDAPSNVPSSIKKSSSKCINQMPTPRKDVLENTPEAYHIQIKGFNYSKVPTFFIDGIEAIPLNLSEHYTSLTYNYTLMSGGRSYILETFEDIQPEIAILSNDGGSGTWITIDSIKVSNKDGHYRWLLNL